MFEVYVACKETSILGESPLWSVEQQMLYWVDIRNPIIHCFDPVTGDRKKWRVQTEIGSIGFAKNNKLIAGTRMGFAYINLEDGSYEALADPEGNGRTNSVRMNDGKVDRAGRFWCGTMEDPGFSEVGSLYRFDPDHSVHRMDGPVRIANALCWSPDNTIMYFADSLKRIVWMYDFDLQNGEIENRREFLTISEEDGLPDGATVDAEGFVWIAHMRGGKVKRYDPHAKEEREIKFPVSLTSCPAFGGANLSTLYVTTASSLFNAADFTREPEAGSLFAVETDVKGIPEPVYG